MIGQTIGHYRITSKIGSGGMGEVYRATDTTLHRDVAVKVISPEFAGDSERMARLEREAQVLASLTHGSIAAVYGFEQSGEHRALVMELVGGEDLSERLRRGPLPLQDALRTAAHIAEALEVAHEHGVIHRDLKPANIRLLESGHVKLLDFGLAKALEDSDKDHLKTGDAATISVAATRAGIILGTAAYMSPEQATGSTADKRSDVWSFGVVLFEMLTGTRLFDGQTTSHVLADVIRADIDFGRLPAAIPSEVRTLVERCLERDPRRRLRDIREARLVLEHAIERTDAHRAVRSGAMVAPPPPRGWQSHVPWMAAAAIAAALLTGGIVWALRPETPTVPHLRVETALPASAHFNPVGSSIELSPDGQTIAMIVAGKSESSASMIVRRLDELSGKMIVPETSGTQLPYNPFFSPDGAWIGYAMPTELRRLPASGGTPLTITKVNRSRGAAWAPDGTIVFAASPGGGLSRVPVTGGEPQALTTLDTAKNEATHRWPQILPDGRTVLFTSHSNVSGGFDGASIEAVDLQTGKRTHIHAGGSYGRYAPSGHLVYLANGTIFAVPFDPGTLTVRGQPVPVVQDVTHFSGEGSANVTFAANGLLVYMRGAPSTPQYQVAWVDRKGGITTLPLEPGTYANPRLSPDGKRIAFTVFRERNWDIWVYDIERQVFTRVTFDEGVESEQVWSPDGRELIFSLDAPANRSILKRRAADGSGTVATLLEHDDYLWPSSWSADGTHLAMTTGSQDIAIMTLTGTPKPTTIVQGSFAETDASISPDGRFIAYTSRESGRPEIYVRQFPSGGGRWQVSRDGGAYPRWSRRGGELFFRTSTGIMSIPVTTTAGSFQAGTPRQLFSGAFVGGVEGLGIDQFVFPDYDVAPDGSRFIMFPRPREANDEQRGLITLVTNWFDELKQRAGR